MYNYSTIQKRGLGFIMKRATITTTTIASTKTTLNTINTINTKSTSRSNSVSSSLFSPRPSIPIMDTKLKVYVSLDTNESKPGPNSTLSIKGYDIYNGFLSFNISSLEISSSSSNKIIYIGLFAPNQTEVTGDYNYQIGVSTNTDNSTALFRINDETINLSASFLTYIVDSNSVVGLYNSLCAYESNTPDNINITYSETTRGFIYPDKGKKVTISINNLKNGMNYTALVISKNINGKVNNITDNSNKDFHIDPILLHTKSLAYSVPANPLLPISKIIKFYDELAEEYFKNFTLTLSQFSCNKTHYSLVRSCNDCLESYKNWICAMTVPRCGDADFFSTSDDDNDFSDSSIIGGIARNANKSRIPKIDKEMVPGAYIEIPPCINLCYNTTQSYGIMNSPEKGSISNVTCNPMGSDWIKTNSATRNNLILFYWWKWIVGIIGIIEIIFQLGLLLLV
ncbi:2519_t:CDS:2 [Diversispora eburnea]|uniref:2519_t:CDS:1 n=1 Tax=Diversispora eburnea TaxID=1213867 RepID=A0A9N8VS10_9GLOM|nr:2519_t:CDS:2 [Diversispora eburnea]